MKVTVAIDSFKGSMTTMQAANAAYEGIKRVFPNADVALCPLADGGEGTVNALVRENREYLRTVEVCGPLSLPVSADYGIIDGGRTAVIEMAAAAGLTLVEEPKRNPMHTTTYGVGELIKDALMKGCTNFIIGIGGSATNDCGIGMLSALGFEFTDKEGNDVEPCASGLEKIENIELKNALPELKKASFHIACDVKNVLCGENGCSYVYAPQKGATPEDIEKMDAWIARFASLTAKKLGKDNSLCPGVGAAGGLGFAFMTYLGASLESGIDMIIRETHLEENIKNSDIVITGEGRLDGQTAMGKAPVGVAKIANKYNIPVIALAGGIADGAELCNESGISAFFPIVKKPCTLSEAMDFENACKNMSDSTEQIFRLIGAFVK
ncbi:MAG: glycerate kinase [Ruminococcaceae bacterium]|nr:glycerate kinase [Oscillospiraceae bacterium]